MPSAPPLLWDIFCQVIDNHGDIGVCWRLAAQLAQRGQQVRLWVDQPAALAWMAPGGAPGVQVLPWSGDSPSGVTEPGDVVIEAFGCQLPDRFITRMAAMQPPPRWINLEYLSAEAYVERCHGLSSPQFSGPGAGLVKTFVYPGFTLRTGGLLHGDVPGEADGPAIQRWLGDCGWATRPEERPQELSLLVFCYDNPALPDLLRHWASLAGQPVLLRLAPGPMQTRLAAADWPASVRCVSLTPVSQPRFDQLLAASDINLVRGEDSFVRAQLASDAPFLWQIYPQHDQAHVAKLAAFLDLYLHGADPALAGAVRQAFLAVNGLLTGAQLADAANPGSELAIPCPPPWPPRLPLPPWPPLQAWRAWHSRWRERLLDQPDLCSHLISLAGKAR